MYIIQREIYLICLFVPPSTSLITVVILDSCHCAYISVSCLVFRVNVAGDLKQKISFVVRVLDYVRSRFTRAHPVYP